MENEECFRFVVCSKKLGQWMFKEYTPTEFMQFSCIPPFKVYFNVAIGGTKTPPSDRISKSIGLTRERLRLMLQLYGQLRNGEATSSAPGAASIGLTRQKRPAGSREETLPKPFIKKQPNIALLSGRHYVRRASAENYWFDFARSKVLSLQRRHGDNFCLVIDGESQGKYAIPFAAAKRYFTDQTLDRRRNRWVGTIVGGRLNLGSTGTSFAVEEYRNRFELL